MIRVALGTKENVAVAVTDITGATLTLVGSSPSFDVVDDLDATLATGTPTISVMTLLCLCDFSNTVTFPIGFYRLFVDFNVTPQIPRLGPYNIQIVDRLIEG